MDDTSTSFSARIIRVGINPCVDVPKRVSLALGRRGYVPVAGTLNGRSILATLVPTGGGHYRLYINGEMRRKAGVDVGDRIRLALRIDKMPRIAPVPKELLRALESNPEAKAVFEALRPSHRRDILLYLNWLKRPESRERNVKKVTDYLLEMGESDRKRRTGTGSVLARPPNWYETDTASQIAKSRDLVVR